jgi:hypothetical protein
LGSVAEGKADETIEAAAALIKQIRERRQKKTDDNSGESQANQSNGNVGDDTKPSRRPVLDALRRAIRQP